MSPGPGMEAGAHAKEEIDVPHPLRGRLRREAQPPVEMFFRWLLIIPHLIVAYLYGIAFLVTVVIAWFALVFTARYPKGLYEFNAGVVRFFTRFNGYRRPVTDQFPSFGTAPDEIYPVPRAGRPAPGSATTGSRSASARSWRSLCRRARRR